MENLHLFSSATEHYDAWIGSGYTEPWVGYDTEENRLTYNYGVLEANRDLFRCIYPTINYALSGQIINNDELKLFKELLEVMSIYEFSLEPVVRYHSSSSGNDIYNIYYTSKQNNYKTCTLRFVGGIPTIEAVSVEDALSYFCEHNATDDVPCIGFEGITYNESASSR